MQKKPTNIEKSTRLKTLILSLGLSQREFCEQTNLAFSSVSQFATGERALSDRAIFKIANRFANVNPDWLRTGEGEMFKTKTSDPTPDPMDQQEIDLRKQVDSMKAEIARMAEDLSRERGEKKDLLELLKSLTAKYG